MLKAFEILGCSPAFVTQHWKQRTSQRLFSSISISSSSPYPSFKPLPSSMDSSSLSASSHDISPSPSSSVHSAGNVQNIKFCQWCGGPTKHDIPEGEERLRAICTICGTIAYQNPKMVVGCLIEHDNKVLLCKRKIEPSYGLWTLPAGYLEIGESAMEGAIRETREEANADVEVISPFAQLDIPLIGQTYIIFLAKLKKPHFSPGPESSECQLFSLNDIPFNSLSFSSMMVTLSLYVEDIKAGKLRFHYGTINKRYFHPKFRIFSQKFILVCFENVSRRNLLSGISLESLFVRTPHFWAPALDSGIQAIRFEISSTDQT